MFNNLRTDFSFMLTTCYLPPEYSVCEEIQIFYSNLLDLTYKASTANLILCIYVYICVC